MGLADRLTLALDSGHVVLPETGRIAVFAPRAGVDLSALPRAGVQVITGFAPDFRHFSAEGYDCAIAPSGRYAAALVCLPRAKALAHALIAQAAGVSDGPVIVDGDKTDGIESVLRALRARAETGLPLSKAHGKICTFGPGADLSDWQSPGPREIEGGFVTAPGVFSADGIDPGSRLLGDTLPASLGAHVIDLGGGWGYLSARALERDSITRLDLVEADHAALDCARRNLPDPRAHLHWADATGWRPETRADSVIMNPPFHTGRTADTDLGRAFIAAAADMLKPAGALWLVSNRHLPYESTLAERFKRVTEAAGDVRFKILHASHPSRQRP
ncbi:class I SAM-dependent methyltransferase [Roseovarius autotrophicus]|uniref:class I SAM-dependent methyltransferase n=1 Tax=Roseovarius autotrophicus TaxID=2824121 RepID=UPI001B35F102